MKNLLLTACALLLSVTIATAQEKKEETHKKEDIQVVIKDGAKPDIYVDGKKFDFSIELLDKDKIATVNILKGDEALKKYNAKNGVVIISTKEETMVDIDKNKSKIKIKSGDPSKKPVIIIDGLPAKKADLKKLSPDDIETINVVKGKKAIEGYNAPNGAVIVITKKENKK